MGGIRGASVGVRTVALGVSSYRKMSKSLVRRGETEKRRGSLSHQMSYIRR
jgi:hypothetical protein